jgi:hypothetical protein
MLPLEFLTLPLMMLFAKPSSSPLRDMAQWTCQSPLEQIGQGSERGLCLTATQPGQRYCPAVIVVIAAVLLLVLLLLTMSRAVVVAPVYLISALPPPWGAMLMIGVIGAVDAMRVMPVWPPHPW